MNCKNPGCSNETKNKNVYCSLKCRNIYINKYCLDYEKVKNTFETKRKLVEKEYLLNPKMCKKCEKIIPFENRSNKFCNNSCSVSFNNKKTNTNKNYKGFSHKISVSLKEYYKRNEKIRESKICKNCNNEYRGKNKFFCSSPCKEKYTRKNMDKYTIYKSDSQFRFSLNNYPDEFDFELIERYGWYSPKNSKNPNLNGVSRDHMLSINDGFLNAIDSKIISHPANCVLMRHPDNISKNKKSSISLADLEKKILEFDSKYGNVVY